MSARSGAEGEASTDSPLWLPSMAAGGSALGSRCRIGWRVSPQGGRGGPWIRLPRPSLTAVDGRTSCVVPPGPRPASAKGSVLTEGAFAAYVMPLLFTGRDKEESCTEDVPTVAMTVSKPPSPPSTNSS